MNFLNLENGKFYKMEITLTSSSALRFKYNSEREKTIHEGHHVDGTPYYHVQLFQELGYFISDNDILNYEEETEESHYANIITELCEDVENGIISDETFQNNITQLKKYGSDICFDYLKYFKLI